MNFQILFSFFVFKSLGFYNFLKINQTMINQYDIVRLGDEDVYFYKNNNKCD